MRLLSRTWLSSCALTLALTGSLIACGSDSETDTDSTATDTTAETTTDTDTDAADALESIAAIASGNDDFSTLVAALQAADLVDTFAGEGNFTVFAPTNAAFDALPEGALEGLLADKDALTAVLTYHVLGSEVRAADLVEGKNFAATLNGANAVVEVGDAGVTINKAGITATDVEASNGVIHIIDQVILPPSTVADIVYTSAAHTVLMGALESANLVDTLDGEGTFTVFAPTDDAFQPLIDDGTIASLSVDALTNILLYHVLGSAVFSTDIDGPVSVATLEGSEMTVSPTAEGGVSINDAANVAAADLAATNGVLHVIDSVLLPPAN